MFGVQGQFRGGVGVIELSRVGVPGQVRGGGGS